MRMLLGKHKEFDRSRPHHIYTYSHNPKRAFFLEHARIFGGWWRGCKFIRIRDGWWWWWWWWWLLLWLICFRSFYGDGFTMVARFVSPHLSQPRPFTSILGVSWNFESIIKVKISKNSVHLFFHAFFLNGLLLADSPFDCLDLRVWACVCLQCNYCCLFFCRLSLSLCGCCSRYLLLLSVLWKSCILMLCCKRSGDIRMPYEQPCSMPPPLWLNLFELGIQLQHPAIHTGIVWVSAEVHEFQTLQSNFPFDTAAGDQWAIFSLVLSFYCLWRVNSLPLEISDIPPCPRNRPHTTMLQKSSVGDRAPHIRACFAKKRKLFFWDRFCGVWMLVENGGFRNSTAYSQCCLKSRIPQAPYRFWSKSKKKVVIRFQLENGLMCGNIGLQPWTLHYLLLWLVLGERDQKELF